MLRAKKRIKKLEKRFLDRSVSAFAAAWKKSQGSGQRLVISDQGSIYEIQPDGTRTLMKQVEPPTRVKPGLRIHIR